MAFDNTNPTDLAALKSEYINDPEAIGYAAANGTTKVILSLLNDAANNATGATVNKPSEELDIPEIAAVIDSTEYDALSAFDKEWVKMFINKPAEEMLKPYRAKFLEIFGNGTATRTAVLALRRKSASRAEELFGVNTVITRHDLILARENG